MGSVVRVGAATKALHFLRAHSGVLPKALMDKGSRAPGSGLRALVYGGRTQITGWASLTFGL